MADDVIETLSPEEQAATKPDVVIQPRTPTPEPPSEPENVSQETSEEQPEPEAPARPAAMVPSSRLREETEKRREIEQRYQRDFGKMEERLTALQRAMQPEQPKAPDWDTAPLDAGKKLEQEVRQILERDTQREQQQNFTRAYASHAQQFAATQPDFPAAYQHFVRSVAEELNDAGWTDPVIVEQEIRRLEASIATKAMQDGKNAAERIYAVAKRRGYAQAAPATDTAADDIAITQRGAVASRSVGGGGKTPTAGLTMAKLLDMDDDDFAKVSNRDWKRAMGG